MAHPGIAEIMASAGFDWLAIDLEHSVITIREAEELIRVIELCGVSPLVRLSSNDAILIKRVMDAGAHGIIAPAIESRADAERAVSAVHYPPKGCRGVGLARAQDYGASFDEYVQWLARESIVIGQIESMTAVGKLEEIMSVEGLDAYLIGQYDLSSSLGTPGDFEQRTFVDAKERIRETAARFGIPCGIHMIEPDVAKMMRAIDGGFNLLGFSLDAVILSQMCKQAIAEIAAFRAAGGQSPKPRS